MKNLVGKIALVTGAASGIGRATAIEFARTGCDVVMVDIDEAGLEECHEMVKKASRRGWTYICDVSDKKAMENLAVEVTEDAGGIDILVNCAGVGQMGDIRRITLDDWEWIMGINVWGTIYGVHYFLPGMVDRGGGHIVNISSMAGLVGLAQCTPYCTSKFAVLGMAESLRADLRHLKIGVTAVCPGIVSTGFSRSSLITLSLPNAEKLAEQGRQYYNKLGSSPQKVARATVKAVRKNRFLCLVTPESRFLYWTKRIFPSTIWRVGALVSKWLAGR